MKNFLKTSLLALLVTSTAQAWNDKYFDISSGQTTVVDVADQKNVISLKWKVRSVDGFAVPTANVLKELGDFQCQIKNQILLTSDYNQDTKMWSQAWEIKVQWTPGTDFSGCLIQVSHPYETSAFAELVMRYNLHHDFSFRAAKSKSKTPPEKNDSCETYECGGGDGRNSGNNGPDDVYDGPTRGDEGGGFDGGGYGGDDYNT